VSRRGFARGAPSPRPTLPTRSSASRSSPAVLQDLGCETGCSEVARDPAERLLLYSTSVEHREAFSKCFPHSRCQVAALPRYSMGRSRGVGRCRGGQVVRHYHKYYRNIGHEGATAKRPIKFASLMVASIAYRWFCPGPGS
jgi:hypothetical protein